MSTDNNEGGSPLEMQSLVESRFRSNDLELLETGQFSDARLNLGGTVWNVHKSIVCMRSGFMKDAFSPLSESETDEAFIEGQTEEQVNLLLEFIYSGSIKNINDLSLKECVDLCSMGTYCRVQGMVCYAVNTLWDKLMAWDLVISVLQARSSIPTIHYTNQSPSTISDSSGRSVFTKSLEKAVIAAYSDHDNACQLVLADFVSVAQAWLLRDPIILHLQTLHPKFGSDVLTTYLYGPQSPFLRRDRQSIVVANPPAN